jgi:hypothetical protein
MKIWTNMKPLPAFYQTIQKMQALYVTPVFQAIFHTIKGFGCARPLITEAQAANPVRPSGRASAL